MLIRVDSGSNVQVVRVVQQFELQIQQSYYTNTSLQSHTETSRIDLNTCQLLRARGKNQDPLH